MKINEEIKIIDQVICRHIDESNDKPRGMISQDILSQLRNLVEHIMEKCYFAGKDVDDNYINICDAVEYVKTRGELKFLYRMHKFLKIVASHYTLDEENSERLMLKYYEYLLKIRTLAKKNFNMEILHNLEKFPIDTDNMIHEYYVKITEKIDKNISLPKIENEKYYIQKIKPFFVNCKIYYEVTFIIASDRENKTDRIIAFTSKEISDYYSVKFALHNDCVEIYGKKMPIIIIDDWEVSIRACEYKNFVGVIQGVKKNVSVSEMSKINNYLTNSGFSFSDIVEFSDESFNGVKQICTQGVKDVIFFNILEYCREIIKKHKNGENIIRYLLCNMKNIIIKGQYQYFENEKLSKLYLNNKCIPFDNLPYNFSLINHNPKLSDLFNVIPFEEKKCELFARYIRNNAEVKGQLFNTCKDIAEFVDLPNLIDEYNSKLYSKHLDDCKLVVENCQVFINGYKKNTIEIINKIKMFTNMGVQNYENWVLAKLNEMNYDIDCIEKKDILKTMYNKSRVAVIYGAAGTGKTTMIEHVANIFSKEKKLFLAQTNPAIDNLKRRIGVANCTFMTIHKFIINNNVDSLYDIVIIDECSTINNRNMMRLLNKVSCSLMLLAGDIYQINSINFGNWFNLLKKFLPEHSTFELSLSYRSNDNNLLCFWDKVRHMDDTVSEIISKHKYANTLNESIFNKIDEEEVILCLNYDGLYGINNINRFLQESNENPGVIFGIQKYKVGDPIIFNENERFFPVIYNNLKGKIIGINTDNLNITNGYIEFDVEVEKVISGLEAAGMDFVLLENSNGNKSSIRFKVYKNLNVDEDGVDDKSNIVPFQVAYAISIHKAQGLEYNSVKIVITDEIDELITHNIFYTAITRAKKHLKIYWTPEVQERVLARIKPIDISKDKKILQKYIV